MSYNCCSGTFSSRSLGGHLRCPGSSCGSSYPSNLVYTRDLCSPSTCQRDSSFYSGCQETSCEPIRCQASCVESSPCQPSCCPQKTSKLCSPCWTTYPGSLGFRSSSCSFLSSGSGRYYSLRCGSSGFRPLGYGVCGFPSLSRGSRFCRPTCFTSSSCQSWCYRPISSSGFYYSTC
ncbi:keratin-associated protein 13-1-like [Camelus bactrianus]|uniref:Keratin-associated protein n=1 Tax=Camelus bactrianus TaxID=9837 RepID=A0A9W3ESH7_CAMBA|nr:keratin-associated protein 13-1 [Camelus ferus]